MKTMMMLSLLMNLHFLFTLMIVFLACLILSLPSNLCASLHSGKQQEGLLDPTMLTLVSAWWRAQY